MADWRRHARAKNWEAVRDNLPTNEAEREELYQVVASSLRQIDVGEGLDVYRRHIEPLEARDRNEENGAEILRSLAPKQDTFDELKRFAVREIMKMGIDFYGLHSTVLYISKDNKFVQLAPSFGKAILQRKSDFIMNLGHKFSPVDFVAWQNLYPWRRCESLADCFRFGRLGENTRLWHAVSILKWMDLLKEITYFDDDIQTATTQAAQCGLAIGRSYQSLIFKQYEEPAITGLKVKRGQKMGAAMRRRQTERATDELLDVMDALVTSGRSISYAATIAHQRGYGTSPTANRAAWYRNTQK